MRVEELSRPAWSAFVDQCDQATFFHTPVWYEVWQKYQGYQMKALLFRLSTNKQVCLPIARKRKYKGLSYQWISSPAGVYGGFLSDVLLDAEEIEVLNQWLSRLKSYTICHSPFYNYAAPKNDSRIPLFTQWIDLRQYQLENDWSMNHRRSLRKARQGELEVFVAHQASDWESYFAIYQDSLKRWGKTPERGYQAALFRYIQSLPDHQCRLWLVRFQGQIISGVLCFYHRHHVVYWHGASLGTYFKLKPVHLLLYQVIKDAQEKAFWWFDFNPSGGHEGVVKFKKDFGAQRQPLIAFKRERLMDKVYDQLNQLRS